MRTDDSVFGKLCRVSEILFPVRDVDVKFS